LPPIVPNPIDKNSVVNCTNDIWYGYGDVYLNSSIKQEMIIDGNLLIMNMDEKYRVDNKVIVTGNLNLEGYLVLKKGFFNISGNLIVGQYAKIYIDDYCFWKAKIVLSTLKGYLTDDYNSLKHSKLKYYGLRSTFRVTNSTSEKRIFYRLDNVLLKIFFHDGPLVLVTCFTLIILPIFVFFFYKTVVKVSINYIKKKMSKEEYMLLDA
jgi:hypothetical protein